MSTQILISGLPKSIEESDIRAAFSSYGKIKAVYIPEKGFNDQSACFVAFSSHDEAKEAIHELNYSAFTKGNEKNTIKLTYGDEETLTRIKNGENKVIIENLEGDITEANVYEMFSHYGEVIYCSMPLALTGKPIGVCFVVFNTKEECDTAIEELNESAVNGKTVTVRYAPEL